MTSATVKTYYLVRVWVTPHPEFAARMAKGGLTTPVAGWLYLARDRNGYLFHSNEPGAERFKTPPTLAQVRGWSGNPWMDIHDMTRAPLLDKVTETRTIETSEEGELDE